MNSELLFPECPVRNVLARIGDKWSLLVMHTLHQHEVPMRFSTLQRALPDITQKVLTTTLRRLEADGFVQRTVYPEVPPRVEYLLTDRACSFLQACQPMIQWAIDHMAVILKDRSTHAGE